MDTENTKFYLLVATALTYFIWKLFKFKKIKKQIPIYLQQGALIIDVRSEGEFKQGHNPLSTNIPLPELGRRSLDHSKEKPILLCCASGSRSAMAVGILKAKGYTIVINAGPWTNTLGST